MVKRTDDNPVFRLGVFDQLSITLTLLSGLGHAVVYKGRHSMAHVKLPEVRTPRTGAPEVLNSLIQQVMKKTDTLVNLIFPFTSRKCFFRSYAAACVLRRLGIGAVLNMGMKHLKKNHQHVRGHCWLTWQGRPIAEELDPRIRFSRFIGSSDEGICYWIGGNHAEASENIPGCGIEQEISHAA